MSHLSLESRRWALMEVLLIVGFAVIPLFMTFPYRVNIFLTWEGAYRIAQGQVPFKDYGAPLGYGFWIIPALFMKLFGVQLITLVKAQVFLNILAGLSFAAILRTLEVRPGLRLISILLFIISYSLSNFWPWYNHTVIVYELAGLAFLLKGLFTDTKLSRWVFLVVSAFFLFLSFFTKQDGGALGLLIALGIVLYNVVITRRWMDLVVFLGAYGVIALAIILPLLPGFGYWFNHGQAPHSSRIDPYDIFNELMTYSVWIKAYLVLVVFSVVAGVSNWRVWLTDRKQVTFTILTLGILGEATVFQITSYTPPDNNIFFHAFSFAFIANTLCNKLAYNTSSWKFIVPGTLLVLLWWSGSYWKYADRLMERMFGHQAALATANPTGENVVSRHNYMIFKPDTSFVDEPVGQWVFTDIPVFRKMYMPASTVAGIQKVMALPVVKAKGADLKVLNMSELTPLAAAMHYKLETGPDIPLWHHLGVGMFNRQLKAYEEKIRQHHYDLVIFEYAPLLNNFYPFALRQVLKDNYQQVDTFLAPRRPTNATIEIYIKAYE
ncbi:hypothetical protein SAMN05444266_103278 [Chitinophaga jiangningensis]|uniref:Dolichyl-phosphate-mannose-protein mannosyltransferase n=1 Tax=Chitinophaga jiangningensis TaxID=1419482 RepID=A0A1M7AH12_9BACT|nr:hypothetical protein [Chitinophaga jiangningensis]SHL42050.1 hypothetical protein SAMN05444266_103278 [Chitinophaga jiangningensis]